jgi:5-(carboxyamino)imidazole ribonucleotide synthase
VNIQKLAIIGPNKGPGQLGMLLAHEANKLHCAGEVNLKILTIGQDHGPDWSDEHFDLTTDNLKLIAKQADQATYETESITEDFREQFGNKLRPSKEVLDIFRNRYYEKSFFKKLKLPTVKFFYINDQNSLDAAVGEITEQEFVGRLKTCEGGYDGLRQIKVKKPHELQIAWTQFDKTECVLEEEIKIFRELSVICTRYKDGQIVYFPVPQNEHQDGVLYRSKLAKLNKKIANKLQKMAEKIVNKLNYIGTFTLEVFQIAGPDGALHINEAAPRVHNSGHFTLEFCEGTNQFDSHIRAICDMALVQPSEKDKLFSMTNLLEISKETYQKLQSSLTEFNSTETKIQTYWYGKSEARPGRKMGHITVISNVASELENIEAFLDQNLKK